MLKIKKNVIGSVLFSFLRKVQIQITQPRLLKGGKRNLLQMYNGPNENTFEYRHVVAMGNDLYGILT